MSCLLYTSELVVLYHGNLSRILTDPVSKEKKQKVFAVETLTKAKEYEKKTFTQKEIEQQRRTEACLLYTSYTV